MLLINSFLSGKSFKLGEVRNVYHVRYEGPLSSALREPMGPEELACDALDKVKVETFTRGDMFFK